MIRQIHIQNYKALRDVTLDLTPFHVLIGPNDSGKTSILEAVAALCRSVDQPSERWFSGNWQGYDLVWHGNDPKVPVQISAEVADADARNVGPGQYILSCTFQPRLKSCLPQISLRAPGKKAVDLTTLPAKVAELSNSPATTSQKSAVAWAQSALGGVGYYRFNPRSLELPVAFEQLSSVQMDASGFGLAICLEDMLGTQRSNYIALEERFKSIFPQVREIQLRRGIAIAEDSRIPSTSPLPSAASGKEICFLFNGSPTPVPASQVSDGILLTLAYLVVLHAPQPPRVLLIEEPETGIYPPLLQNVVRILRDIVNGQSHTQVIITTHAPYVLDEFQPANVTLCRKDADGSISVHPLSKAKAIKKQLDVFSLGELWVDEIDGIAKGANVPSEAPAK